jgi:hypothetical protein
LKNVGASKVNIEQKGTGLRVFGCDIYAPKSALRPVTWNRLRTVSVFQEHAWIEASETIQDSLLFVLPPNQIAVKVQLRVIAKKLEWSAKAVFDVQTLEHQQTRSNASSSSSLEGTFTNVSK